MVVVRQPVVRQILLVILHRPAILMPNQRPIEPGVGVLAHEEGKLEAVPLAASTDHIFRGILLLLVAVPLRAPHRLDLHL